MSENKLEYHSQKLITVVVMTVFILVSFFISPNLASANIERVTDTDYLKIDSPIVIEFDQLIRFRPQWVNTSPPNNTPGTPSNAFTGITLINLSNNTPVTITLVYSGTMLKVIPATNLNRNTDYELRITDHVVEAQQSPHVEVLPTNNNGNVNESFNFSTESLSFKELMVGSNNKIKRLVDDYTLRQIYLKAPERYINQLDVIHKRREVVQGQATESVTNIDISLKDHAIYNTNGDINRIEVIAKAGNTVLQKDELLNLNLTSNSGAKLYDFSFTQLPDTRAFDIEILLYDDQDELLDSRLIKIPLDTNTITTVKQKDRFKLAGRTFTFYDLLAKPKDLQTLLEENRLNEIKVQVGER